MVLELKVNLFQNCRDCPVRHTSDCEFADQKVLFLFRIQRNLSVEYFEKNQVYLKHCTFFWYYYPHIFFIFVCTTGARKTTPLKTD